jgi:hypothetical protein
VIDPPNNEQELQQVLADTTARLQRVLDRIKAGETCRLPLRRGIFMVPYDPERNPGLYSQEDLVFEASELNLFGVTMVDYAYVSPIMGSIGLIVYRGSHPDEIGYAILADTDGIATGETTDAEGLALSFIGNPYASDEFDYRAQAVVDLANTADMAEAIFNT